MANWQSRFRDRKADDSRPNSTKNSCMGASWTSVSTLLINKSWKNLLPNFIDSEVEENVQTGEIQLASLISQLQNKNPMSNTEAHAEADGSLARNEILTDNEIIRTFNSRR
ncbi:hypothetical protein AVEN_156275-1 [Araneus ventricosus]|uniref:DDE-1 domain-containing protein n=1 Tax=Araneus ventricosus TaxID=182803 RepID=A0A4Y2EPL2_ARAVE|nr:hypothetical protein AVEN_257204-1 [Araneus ventricosus]GBM30171.1 hypothetical protein AVEN_156275-1 [Araneus ventricosus]